MNWLWIAFGWVFLNVIVKLLVNSLERLHREKIDDFVSSLPMFAHSLWVDVFRISLLVVLLPSLISCFLFPKLFRYSFFRNIKYSIEFCLSQRRFRKQMPLMFYFLLHPVGLFSKTAGERANKWWTDKVFSSPELLKSYMEESPPDNSLNLPDKVSSG
jgi:hypothetical protein